MEGGLPERVHAVSPRGRAGRGAVVCRLGVWLGVLLGVIVAGCAERPPALPAELSAWAQGPARWLLLPDELHQFQRLHEPAAARAFIAEFWRRREWRRDEHGFQHGFEERVVIADRAYGEDDVRGSLTDRGGTFILLGAPAVLRSKPLAPRPATLRRTLKPVLQTIEIWGYRPVDVPQLLVRKPSLADRPEIDLEFVIERGRAVLISGRDLLTLAARAAAGEP